MWSKLFIITRIRFDQNLEKIIRNLVDEVRVIIRDLAEKIHQENKKLFTDDFVIFKDYLQEKIEYRIDFCQDQLYEKLYNKPSDVNKIEQLINDLRAKIHNYINKKFDSLINCSSFSRSFSRK
jgi:uncharacterized protein Yka (UPF0111/DUF47 family)